MSPVEWYFARGNKQLGPVSSADLKQFAVAGELLPDDLVWREGLTEWTTARSVRGLFDEESKPVSVEEAPSKPVVPLPKDAEVAAPLEQPVALPEATLPRAPARHPIEVLLESFRSDGGARFVESAARVSRRCGAYGLVAAMVVSAVFASIVTVQTKSLSSLLSAIVLLTLLAVLQYVAGKFCDALDRLNRTTRGILASAVLPDGVGLLSLVAGLAALLGSVSAAVETSAYPLILLGLAGLVVGLYAAFAALNPATLNIAVVSDQSPAGHEAIGTLMFLAKVLLRAAPAAFGAGVVCGTILMGYACCQVFLDAEGPLVAQGTAVTASSVLISSAAFPLVAYLLFLLQSLVVDLSHAILVLPGKLDHSGERVDDEK